MRTYKEIVKNYILIYNKIIKLRKLHGEEIGSNAAIVIKMKYGNLSSKKLSE